MIFNFDKTILDTINIFENIFIRIKENIK